MKKIVIAMIEAGGGHRSPAEAVAESIFTLYGPEIQVEVLDFCKEVGALKVDRMHKEGWNRSLSRPWLTKCLYWFFDFLGFVIRSILSLLIVGFFRKAQRWLETNRPDVFFATHFMAAAGGLYAQKRIKKKTKEDVFPVILQATDPNDINSLWLWKRVDVLIVNSEAAARKAIRKGMKQEKIRIFGYPIRPSFLEITRKTEVIKTEVGVVRDKMSLLITAGGQGLGKFRDFVNYLLQKDFPINLLVVCGRNEDLYQELLHRNMKDTVNTCFVPLGFVSNMNELIAIADLVAIKAGAASTYEALFLHTPVIFIDFVAQNEKTNIDFVLDRGIGWYTPAPEDLTALLDHILGSGMAELEKRKKRIQELDLKNGSPEIAQFLVNQHLN